MSKLRGFQRVDHLDGYYYLHVNEDLIYKRYLDEGQVTDFESSSFVRAYWLLDTHDRGCAWIIAIEAAALGARFDKVEHLREHWKLTNEDGRKFCEVSGIELRVEHPVATVSPVSISQKMYRVGFPDKKQYAYGSDVFSALVELAKQGITLGNV